MSPKPIVKMRVPCAFAAWAAVFLYFIRMFAVTGIYHRYFSHKTYSTSRIGQFFLALWGGTTVQRGGLWWAYHHRHHHRHHCHGPQAACALALDEPHDICVALRDDDVHPPLGAPGFARSLNAIHSQALGDWLHAHTDTYLRLIPEEDHEHAHRVIALSVAWLHWCARHTGFRTHTLPPG